MTSALDSSCARLFANEGDIMIGLHAFMKKQPKTPRPDLDLAKDRLKQSRKRKCATPILAAASTISSPKRPYFEEATAVAVNRVIAWQIEQEIAVRKLTETAMAKKMHTSRAALKAAYRWSGNSGVANLYLLAHGAPRMPLKISHALAIPPSQPIMK